MLEIYDKIIYKEKNKKGVPIPWRKKYQLKVFFSPRTYFFDIKVLGEFLYLENRRIKLRKFVSFQQLNNKKLSKQLLKTLISRYNTRLKYYRIFTEMFGEIAKQYKKSKDILLNIFSNYLPIEIIKSNILPYLFY